MRRLGYYTPKFPYPQGASAGPYPGFVGPRTRVPCVIVGVSVQNRQKKRGCTCHDRRRGVHGFGLEDDSITYTATPTTPASMVQSYLTPTVNVDTTGTYDFGDLVAPASPTSLDVTDLTNAPVTPQPQSPPGTQLVYQVSWTASLLKATMGSSQAMAAFAQALPQYGMFVASSNVTSPPLIGGITGYSATVVISDNVGHQNLTDAQSVCDAVMRSIVGNNVTGSSLTAAAGGSSLSSWLSQNWMLVAGGVLVLAVAWRVVR